MAENDFDYGLGGRLRTGDKLKMGRYEISGKLGYGSYAIVHLARDEEKDKAVAIKVVRSADAYTASAQSEADILDTLGDRAHATPHPGFRCIPELLDTFQHAGRYFDHFHTCLCFPVYGQSLSIVKHQRPQGLAMPQLKQLARQLLLALEFLHQAGVAHTDVKLDNILLRPKYHIAAPASTAPSSRHASLSPPTTSRPHMVPLNMPGIEREPVSEEESDIFEVLLIDFANAAWLPLAEHRSAQALSLRAPEVVLGSVWDGKIDVWSLACVLFEMATARPLFNLSDVEPSTASDGEARLLGMALSLHGLKTLPEGLADAPLRPLFFAKAGSPLALAPSSACSFDLEKRLASTLPADDASALSSFLLPMLAIDPRERPTAHSALEHDYPS